MDALILSCGTGGGHHTAARAIQEELELQGHSTVFLNPYDLHSSKLSARIDNAYIGVAKSAPDFFGALYSAGNLYRKLPCRSPVYGLNGLMAKTMARYLETHHFDVILVTHFFPAQILTHLRHQGMAIPKIIQVATDYTCIPFSEETDCDAYVIPSAALTEEFVGRGIPAERIYPFGIPVRRAFRSRISRNEAKQRLGLDAEKQYLLISGGSMGAGEVQKALELLQEIVTEHQNIRLMVVCGSNEKLYCRLNEQFGSSAEIIGQTDQMALLLQSCSIYLTKPGGLSITEAAVAGVPLALLPPIPGCESQNLLFFEQNGMGKAVDVSLEGLRDIVALLDQPETCENMISQQSKWIPPNAASRICSLALEFI